MKNVTPKKGRGAAKKEALALGAPASDHGRADAEGQHVEGSVTSLRPWDTYDFFVQGYTVEEIAYNYASDGDAAKSSQVVLADIDEMRGRLMLQYPGITAIEADRLRHETLLVIAGHKDGTAAGIKAAGDAALRRQQIIDAGAHRVRRNSEER